MIIDSYAPSVVYDDTSIIAPLYDDIPSYVLQ